MCQATVYVLKDGQREMAMREATRLTAAEEGVQLQAFFDEPRVTGA